MGKFNSMMILSDESLNQVVGGRLGAVLPTANTPLGMVINKIETAILSDVAATGNTTLFTKLLGDFIAFDNSLGTLYYNPPVAG
ncbi:MAG: hypothetical protein WCG04_01010 [Alphaproteobacteria bacterium]